MVKQKRPRTVRVGSFALALCFLATVHAEDAKVDFSGTYTATGKGNAGAVIMVRPYRQGETLDIVQEERLEDKTKAIAWVGEYRTIVTDDGTGWRPVTSSDVLPALAFVNLAPVNYEQLELGPLRRQFGVTCIAARHLRLCRVKPGTRFGEGFRSESGWFFLKDFVPVELKKTR